jgi:hypothetical protein
VNERDANEESGRLAARRRDAARRRERGEHVVAKRAEPFPGFGFGFRLRLGLGVLFFRARRRRRPLEAQRRRVAATIRGNRLQAHDL